MKHVKLLGLALLALFALSAVASSVAMANPTILPEPTEKESLKFTAKTKAGTTPLLENSGKKNEPKVLCEKAEASGAFTSADHGNVTIKFSECKEPVSKAKCKSGATAGVIELEGLIELVDVLPSSVLELGLWLEPFALGGEAKKEDLKFSCGVLNVTVLGSLIALVDEVKTLVKTKKALLLWHQKAGVQAIQECMTLETLCAKGPFDLKAKYTTEGIEELAGQEAEAEVEFAKEAEVHF
jgi:hypothetical protein